MVILNPVAVPITVAAFNNSTIFTNVTFFANGENIGQDNMDPFSMIWFRPDLGTYTLTIVAHDNTGATFTAPPVTIEITDTTVSPPVNQTLITEGSVWKYLDDGSNQGTAWRDPNFDDSAWSAGAAQLGYGDSDETTILSYGPDANNKFITTYFRRTFTAPDLSRLISLSGSLLRDDGGVVFLNGQEVFRSNMPGGTIDYLTPASSAIGDEDEFVTFGIDNTLVMSDPNVIAVEIHQRSGTSSDISFDFALEAQLTPPPPQGIVLTSPADNTVLPASAPVSLTASATPAA
jgi:hypothetical protein